MKKDYKIKDRVIVRSNALGTIPVKGIVKDVGDGITIRVQLINYKYLKLHETFPAYLQELKIDVIEQLKKIRKEKKCPKI
jgi:hypothetical protein